MHVKNVTKKKKFYIHMWSCTIHWTPGVSGETRTHIIPTQFQWPNWCAQSNNDEISTCVPSTYSHIVYMYIYTIQYTYVYAYICIYW